MLDWLCNELEVPRAGWQQVPPIRLAVETIAARRLAGRIQVEQGGGAWHPALVTACWKLGLNDKTLSDRDTRWFRDSRKAA